MNKYLLVVIAFLFGCQTTAPVKHPTCKERIKEQFVGCQVMGSQAVVVEDGVGIAIQGVCADSKGEPVMVIVGVSEAPSLIKDALDKGAKDVGVCVLGPVVRRMIRFESAMPDMRASN